MSRNERDFAPLFPRLVSALEKLPQDTVIDGEIIALNTAGKPSFNLLQNYHSRTDHRLLCFRPVDAERRECHGPAIGTSRTSTETSDVAPE
jgi:hypothetical protein